MSAPALPRRTLLAAATGALALASAVAAQPASAAPAPSARPAGAVFVQLNGPAGNAIASYDRAADGTLTRTGTYPTGGLGGSEVEAPLDALASQSSLVLTRDARTLVAVNAGSDTLTSFAVRGSRLVRASVVPSGGAFPVSVAVRGDLVYALDAAGAGSVTGYRLAGSRLVPLPGSTRSLGLANTNPPLFISAPSQVGFSGDGHVLVVTTKNNGKLLTFPIGRGGRPSSEPVVTESSGPVPFSFVVDHRGGLHVTQAGDGTIASYRVHRDGTLTATGTSASTGGAALCWDIRLGRTIYGANAGSGTLSAWTIGHGAAELTEKVATITDAGPIDLAASRDQRYLYEQNALAGTVGVFAVRHGELSPVQTVHGLPAFANGNGMEGIAAS